MPDNIRKPKAASGPLTVVWRRVEALRPDPANPRSHGPKQICQLMRSIGAFGFNVPILVDRTLRIIAGHARLLAAQELGWREVPTILLDHLSEAEADAFTIADNRIAETAAWNNTLLTEQLNQIPRARPDIAIETTGFELTEIGLLTGKGAVGVRKPSRRPTPRPVPPLSPARRDVPIPRPPK
jgi:ParB-like chromosome segregation protein Spo0J